MLLVYLAVLLRILSNPVSNVFQKQLTDGGHHPLVVNAVSYAMLSAVSMALFGWRVAWLLKRSALISGFSLALA